MKTPRRLGKRVWALALSLVAGSLGAAWPAPGDQASFDRQMGPGLEDFLMSAGAGRNRMAMRDAYAASDEASPRSVDVLAGLVASVLTPDLLKRPWRDNAGADPMSGQCYVASEALFHLIGGKGAGWTPMVLRHEGTTHWFLKHQSGKIVDITASQFRTPVPYDQARGCGFLTREPSRRAAEVIRRVRSVQAGRDWRE